VDFSKLKDGVLAFSVFLASNLFWSCLTGFSIWIAFDSQIGASATSLLTAAQEALQSSLTKDMLENYGLKPLLPTLAFFLIVFALHANKEILVRLGSYIAPTIVFEHLVGLRKISTGRWHYVIGKLGYKYSFGDLRLIIDSRYRDAQAKQFRPSGDEFEIFKSLCILNAMMLVLSVLTQNPPKAQNAILFVFFAICAFVSISVRLYHDRNASLWAIEEVMSQLLAEHVLGETNEQIVSDEKRLAAEMEVDQACEAISKNPSHHLSWQLPLIGSVAVLKSVLGRSGTR
jgi:hypothetical protein